MNNTSIQKVKEICNGISEVHFHRTVPQCAIDIAKENNLLILIGGSDDLFYAYGTDCPLTQYEEMDGVFDGHVFDLAGLENSYDNDEKDTLAYKAYEQAVSLGLCVYWQGITRDFFGKEYKVEELKDYSFSYRVKPDLNTEHFLQYYEPPRDDDEDTQHVYCQGIIIELPKS